MKLTRGRPKAFDEDEALALAMNYFWEHGYENSSLDNLLPAMGIKKSSFYHTFKSKTELFARCLHLYRKEVLVELNDLKKQIGIKEALIMLGTMTIDELKNTGKIKGCLLISSGQECYKKYPDLSAQIAKEFHYFLEIMTTLIQEAQDKGEIKDTLSADVLAGRYLNALNGLLVTIQAGAPETLVDDVLKQLKEMLE